MIIGRVLKQQNIDKHVEFIPSAWFFKQIMKAINVFLRSPVDFKQFTHMRHFNLETFFKQQSAKW